MKERAPKLPSEHKPFSWGERFLPIYGLLTVALTDGVTAAQNLAGEFFGPEPLYFLGARSASTATDLLDSIQARVREFVGEADPSDDIALLAIQRQ